MVYITIHSLGDGGGPKMADIGADLGWLSIERQSCYHVESYRVVTISTTNCIHELGRPRRVLTI